MNSSRFILLKFFVSVLCVSAIAFQASEEDDTKEEHSVTSRSSSTIDSDIINGKYVHGHKNGGFKGDTTVPTSSRYTSARAYVEDKRRDRDGYRYYGTGSKSGNSFLPTNIHKSTSSLDTHNYFVTTKSNLKDLDAAGSGISGGTEGHTNYLTVYEPPTLLSSLHGSNGGSGSLSLIGIDDQFGDLAAETGHGGGGYGGGHGGGHGGGGGKGCNSALGLLGVLGLAAYLQNVLRNMQNGTAGRRKRDVSFDNPHDMEAKLKKVRNGMAELDVDILPLNETSKDLELDDETYKQVMRDVFPLLSSISYASDRIIPVHCTHSSVCQANRVLVKDLGYLGHSVGIRITNKIAKLLTKITKDERAEQIRMISKAGKMGRNGRNCLKVFPTCHRLSKLPTYNIPTILETQHDTRDHSTRRLGKINTIPLLMENYPKPKLSAYQNNKKEK